MATTTHLNDTGVCPWCGAPCTAATSVSGKDIPEPDTAVLLCLECAEPVLLTPDNLPRKPTPEEMPEINAHPQVLAARFLLYAFKASRKHRSN